ncbi:MAG: efflux RND transporter periplasmic adaptor subunit [Pseudomonadota bacterium]
MINRILPLLGIAVLLTGGLVIKSGVFAPQADARLSANELISAGAATASGPASTRPKPEKRPATSKQQQDAPQRGQETGQKRSQGGRRQGDRPAGGKRGSQRIARAAKVVVVPAKERMLAPSAAAPGTIISRNDSRIAAEVSGKITSILEGGDVVKKGGVIAVIDNAPASLTVREREAEMLRLASRANFLADRYQRFAELGDDIGESETSLMQMRSERDEARQQVASAKVGLEQAQFLLDRTQIKSPFTGRVVRRGVQVGEFANPGTEIARIVDIDSLEVRSQASASLVANLKAGDAIDITLGSETVRGMVRTIVPVGDEISRTLEMRVSLPPATGWFVGAPVRVTVPAAEPRLALTAPRDALHIRTDRIDVYRITDDNRAQRIPVTLGVAQGNNIEIIGDLAPGDRLVIRGGERLSDGQPVDVAEAT